MIFFNRATKASRERMENQANQDPPEERDHPENLANLEKMANLVPLDLQGRMVFKERKANQVKLDHPDPTGLLDRKAHPDQKVSQVPMVKMDQLGHLVRTEIQVSKVPQENQAQTAAPAKMLNIARVQSALSSKIRRHLKDYFFVGTLFDIKLIIKSC